MKLLLDECIPKSMKRALLPLNSFTVYEMGWSGTKDKDLLALAKAHKPETIATMAEPIKLAVTESSATVTFLQHPDFQRIPAL